MEQRILLIGGGNMGGAMATRWRAQGHHVEVVEPNPGRRAALEAHGISCFETIPERAADVVVLAIKPQHYAASMSQIRQAIAPFSPLVISIMAGVSLASLKTLSAHVVRAMPNLSATFGESMSVLVAPGIDAASAALAQRLFEGIGKAAWVEQEERLHAVTAISGSGPAYVFALMEAMHNAALQHGLDPALASTLITQTVRGAALLAEHTNTPPATLRAQVTSKGGTTEAALEELTRHGFGTMIEDAVKAAVARSHILSK